MTERIGIAYLLIALMLAAIGGLATYFIYHSRERTYRRRMVRENAAYAAAREQAGDLPSRPGAGSTDKV